MQASTPILITLGNNSLCLSLSLPLTWNPYPRRPPGQGFAHQGSQGEVSLSLSLSLSELDKIDDGQMIYCRQSAPGVSEERRGSKTTSGVGLSSTVSRRAKTFYPGPLTYWQPIVIIYCGSCVIPTTWSLNFGAFVVRRCRTT